MPTTTDIRAALATVTREDALALAAEAAADGNVDLRAQALEAAGTEVRWSDLLAGDPDDSTCGAVVAVIEAILDARAQDDE